MGELLKEIYSVFRRTKEILDVTNRYHSGRLGSIDRIYKHFGDRSVYLHDILNHRITAEKV